MANADTTAPKLAYIDALRGYAVLLVITCHTGGLFSQMPYPVKKLTNVGWHGVQLFFLVSCVTLMMSWVTEEKRGTVSLARFWQKRFFRIAPMYYLAGLFYFLVVPPASGFDLTQMLTSALFVNAWTPHWIPTVPDRWMFVPGGWSIGVEFTFYALFPLFMLAGRSVARMAMLLAATLAVAAVLNPIMYRHYADSVGAQFSSNFVYFWFFNQAYVFVFGGLLYYAIDWMRSHPGSRPVVLLRRFHWPMLAVCAAGMVVVAEVVLPQWISIESPVPPSMLVATLALAAFTATLAANERSPLVNRFACLLGQGSFSAYLLHFAVLHFLPRLAPGIFDTEAEGWRAIGILVLLWLATVPITLALSTLTFRLIEQPMIQLGRRLAPGKRYPSNRPITRAV